MNNIETFLTYTYPLSEKKLSIHSKNELKKLYNSKSRKTYIGKRILVFNALLILAISIVTPISVYAAARLSNSLYEMVQEKTKNGNLTEKEIQEILIQFENQENAKEYIYNYTSLEINENEQTYGPDIWNADLITVISDQGDLGYVYREELYYDDISSPDEAIQYNKEVKILNVYLSDGKTIIGTFTIGE